MMLPILKNLGRWVLYCVGGFIVYVLGYMGIAYTLSHIAVNAEPKPTESIQMYILTNGVHTDLILPVKTEHINWSELFPYANTKANDTTLAYIGIGWGDKGFYLNTPTWADLTFTTAFNAVFGLSTTAVHATYHDWVPENRNSFKMTLSADQYKQLIDYIKQSLQLDASGKPLFIQTDANYGNHDAFYEAIGSYSMFTTCNTWTNDALKCCGQKACYWTPFQSGIFYQYDKH